MGPGKAFELLVKQLLLNIGFTEINSDGLYVFDGAAGQMIQGLGEAHNADVLLEPPVQTPFYASTRILIECKDYTRRVGLNTVRSALGLREDINHFDIVDKRELEARRIQRRSGLTYNYTRYYYQVALASTSGYTVPAQKFAATHRIPLLEFNKLPFWEDFCNIIHNRYVDGYLVIVRDTASFQPAIRLAFFSSSPDGVNTRSMSTFFSTSSWLAHTPLANPAKYTAPKAVISVSAGRNMLTPRMSD